MENEVKPLENELSTSQKQVHDLIFNKEIDWKEIIFDLINTEQLNPWDININILADKFFEKIQEYERLDFFISSKVLLAASLLLRIKSELILSKYLRSIDDILFGNAEEENKRQSSFERIELDEIIPDLIPKSPLPRYKRVTLNELIESLNKAIITENRRIKKTIVNQNALRETGIVLPKRKFDIQNRLKLIQSKLTAHFEANISHKKISYTDFIGIEKEERAISFFPLLQLETNGEVWLEQEKSLDEIHIWLKHVYLKHNPDPFKELEINSEEFSEEELKKLEELDNIEVI